MKDKYLCIKESGEHEIIIDKSRFICYIDRANSEEEAHEFIKNIRKQHYNANHNCFSYIISENAHFQKANDDGEPSGTAGMPMLEVLRRTHLTDTVCVVTRYFGGIKLGAGGLIRAYSTAVSEAIKNVGIIEKKKMQVITLTAQYSQINLFDSRLAHYEVIDKRFLDLVFYDLLVDVDEVDSFLKWFIELTNGKNAYQLKEIKICEIEYKKE